MNLKKNIINKMKYAENTSSNNSEQTIIKNTFIWLSMVIGIVFGVGSYISHLIDLGNIAYTPLFWGSFIISIILIITISGFYEKLNYLTLAILFIIFAISEGIGIGGILSFYNQESIITSFLGASILFGIMGFYGYTTKKDLSKLGTLLLIGLISIIIITLINIFIFHSAIMAIILQIIGLLIFLGFTAYDLQLLKEMARTGDKRVEIVFGVSLFLNFINIFIHLLSLFGNRDD